MSTPRRGDATPSLTTLPNDILLHILHLMTPTQLALFSQLSRHAHHIASDPALWAAIARTHFGISPPTDNPTPATVSALAKSLVSRWWVVMGAFVPDMAVHFRRGFVEVRTLGGIIVPFSEGGESAYVFGGRHAQLAVPAHTPSLSMDFFLNPDGPFPMGGLALRIVHVAEQAENYRNNNHSEYVGLPSSIQPPSDIARARVKLNETIIEDVCLNAGETFETVQVLIEPHLLRTKPSMNTVTIEYDRQSSAAYWVREVLIVPTIMPMPKIEKEKMSFSISHDKKRGKNAAENQEGLNSERAVNIFEEEKKRDAGPTAPRSSARSREASPTMEQTDQPSSPRRTLRLVGRDMTKHNSAIDVETRGKAKAKHLKQAKMPKHMYHHNHFRSPRWSAPTSPRARGGR